MPTWGQYLEENQPRFLDELMAFLSIPSISAMSAHAGDVQRAAEWVSARVTAAGMEHVQILPTGGHPVVYADWLHAPGKPTVMIYGHFDVQPVDPLNLWTKPPFEPDVRDGKVYARGASDDKGNMLVPILAVEAMLKAGGALPVNLKFFFEGQEEIGSPQRGSIPVCSLFQRHLGAYTANFAFGIEDEGAHSPDEFFRLASFRKGQAAYCTLLERLGK